MTQRTCNIECRFGDRDVDDPPSDDDILKVVSEVLDETALLEAVPELLTSDLEEHPNAWLQVREPGLGSWVLDVYRTGLLLFTAYSDDCFESERLHARIQPATIARTASLWRALRDGSYPVVEEAFEDSR